MSSRGAFPASRTQLEYTSNVRNYCSLSGGYLWQALCAPPQSVFPCMYNFNVV